MIVVAIVGILAAIALPAYQDYVIRSKMSEGTAAAAACKTSVSEFVSSRNAWPANADTAGCSTIKTQYVNNLTVTGNGVIRVETRNTGSKSSDCILTLTPGFAALPDITSWTGTHGGCDAKYVPSTFR